MSFATTDLIDAHEQLQSCELQFRNFGRATHFSGAIRTVRCRHDNALVKRVLGEPGRGMVLVVDGAGSLWSALLGDMIAASALAQGWAGVLINGAVRDSAALATLALGIKALGTNPRRSAKRGDGDVDVAVQFGGVTFTPGHHLYSDQDGVVVAPAPLL
ncbi:MAG: ribonuclease E activity regulator RraA [Gammaproteobacteria bacterium]|nr:ribonuclease E activity regulator RraA [Gammaproteobacteria bacterium]